MSKDRLVYFYRRDIPEEMGEGYDQISFIAWSKTQADTMLKDTVIKPEEWEYNHVKNIDKTYLDEND